MEFNKIFRAGLLASTSALALAGAANAQGTGLVGLYGGVGLGWEANSGSVKVNEGDGDRYEWPDKLSNSGIFGNLFAGYRVPIAGPWVIGGEAKLTFGGAYGYVEDAQNASAAHNHMSARSKFGLNIGLTAGYQMTNGMLPFVRVGYAGKTMKMVGSVPSAGSMINTTKWLSGMEFGAGIDIPIGVIGGALNMPAFLRAETSYTAMFGGGAARSKYDPGAGEVKYRPDSFQAGVAFGLKF